MIRQILAAADGLAGVLEIGPGPGILTQGLAARSTVIALELDDRLAEEAARVAPKARILRQDALQADWAALLGELPQPCGIVSNMPYQISAQLLVRTADCAGLIDRAVLMMQKEVGEKLLALPGDSRRGSLSVWIQACFTLQRVCSVPPGAFRPPPKVDSLVLRLTPRAEPAWTSREQSLVRRAFSRPLKTLGNNLKQEVVDWEAADVSPGSRPHQLVEEEWKRLIAAWSNSPNG
ncbi:MAG: hypothetical protein MH204_09195 [Fimbriimonadaceae bacterium]|nr:hypothetical protein [Fimbriimonadaceae bacterium]